jgi:hypothetical protein
MHQFAVATAIAIPVASCAGTIKERMDKFEGLPLSAAIAKIGLPLDESHVASFPRAQLGRDVVRHDNEGPSPGHLLDAAGLGANARVRALERN